MQFYVIKKNRWFASGILNIGLKQKHMYTDNILYAKHLLNLEDAKYILNSYQKNNILPLYKGEWKIKKYEVKEIK